MENIIARRDEVYDALTLFEVARRTIYGHCRMSVPPDHEREMAATTRSMGALLVELATNCPTCRGRFSTLGRKAYLEWYSKLPFLCDHRFEVTGMRVEMDQNLTREHPPLFMPERLTRVDPPGASVSSGGPARPEKLQRDRHRLIQNFNTTFRLLREMIALVRRVKYLLKNVQN